jgi:hypothetical protein
MKIKTGMKQLVKAEQVDAKVVGVVLCFNGGDRERIRNKGYYPELILPFYQALNFLKPRECRYQSVLKGIHV